MISNSFPSADQLEEMCQRYLESVNHRAHGIIAPDGNRACSHGKEKGISAYDELMSMVGMHEVKTAVDRQLSYHKIMELRRKSGRRVPDRLLHLLLTGNPGTGKTTCARLIGRIYKDAGLLTSGHMVETSRANLVGQYIGQSEKLVSEKIQAARGGVLFIDEIYSLTEASGGNADNKDFGYRVLDTLLPVLSNPASNIMVIGAGYTSEMQRFLKANPGLASRFPVVLDFKDFTLGELMEIAHKHLAKFDFQLSDDADRRLEMLLAEARLIKNSGNARLVVNLIENHILPNLCMRLDKGRRENNLTDDMSTILPEDIPSLREIAPLQVAARKRIGFGCI